LETLQPENVQEEEKDSGTEPTEEI
jgi:hypothetical protein